MNARWGPHSSVAVTRHIGGLGCERETWHFTLERGAMVLRGYAREMLPSRRHRVWRLVDRWGGNRPSDNTLTAAQVPLDNALAAEILQHIAQSLEIRHGDREWPSMGYRLAGDDDPKVEGTDPTLTLGRLTDPGGSS